MGSFLRIIRTSSFFQEMPVMPEVRKIEAIRKLPELKNVAIYARVSTLHDSQEGSLDNQIEGLKDYL
jgi:predicted site-specific integrase-resolvase